MSEKETFGDNLWYMASVGVEYDSESKFILSAPNEEEGIDLLNNYSKEHRELGIPLQMPWGVELKPLDPLDEDYYRALGTVYPRIRLISQRHSLPIPQTKKPIVANPDQPNLFLMDRRGMTSNYVDLTVEERLNRLQKLYAKMKQLFTS